VLGQRFDGIVDKLIFHDIDSQSAHPLDVTKRERRGRTVSLAVLVLTLLGLLMVPVLLLSCGRESRTPISSVPAPPVVTGPILVSGSPTPAGPGGTAMPTPVANDPRVPTGNATPAQSTPLSVLETPAPLPTSNGADARYAFLLLGYGGGGHDGAYLTDSLMVAIVDPARKTVTLLSLPRDSWVPLSTNGKTSMYQKINTAYAYAQDPSFSTDQLSKYSGAQGPGTFASDTISSVLGIPIRYYVALDFQGFRDMIDAMGGVNVDVQNGFAARYPANDDPSIDASWITVTFAPGMQHMNGERAIEFARARETIDDSGEGNDFARSRRQRLIIEAFKDRLFQPGNFLHLPQLLGIASSHIDTNYAIPAIGGLTQFALDWKSVKIYQTAITIDNYLKVGTGPDGAYILTPNVADHSWAQIRAFARRLWQDPAAGIAMAATPIIVENDSGIPGLAGRTGDDLARLGYRVGTPRTGVTRARSQILVGTNSTVNPLDLQLGSILGLGTLEVVTETSATDELVLQLGEDAANVHLLVFDDAEAPSSAVGVENFDGWAPFPSPTSVPANAVAPPVMMPTPVPPRAVLLPTSTPRPLPRATSTSVSTTTADATTVIVPRLVGLLEADAQTVIGAWGLTTAYVNYQTASDVANKAFFQSIRPDGVLSQNPPAGTRVGRGTRVFLAVRKP
jgi:LCP family protein required for cell wall assembly